MEIVKIISQLDTLVNDWHFAKLNSDRTKLDISHIARCAILASSEGPTNHKFSELDQDVKNEHEKWLKVQMYIQNHFDK